MKKLKMSVTLCIALLVFLTGSLFAQSAGSSSYIYYARLDYVLSTRFATSILIGENQVSEITAPPPPPGYDLYYIKVTFPGGMPDSIVPVKYDKAEFIDNKVFALMAYTDTVKLASKGTNAAVNFDITVYYVRSTWLRLTEGTVKFLIEEPPPPFTKNDLTVKLSIDNHAPFAISGLKGPNEENLLNLEPNPDAIRVDYKHVELNFAYLELGEYSVILKEGEDYILPPSYIAIEPPFKEDTIQPGSAKRYGLGQVKGWRGIGSIVIIHTIAPLSGRGGGDVEVLGELVDFAYYKNEVVTIKAASFLIPNINLKIYIKAYIVFGAWFEIKNNMKNSVNVMYTNVFIKETGNWLPTGVEMIVRDSDIKDAMAAYLVVQAPSYGKITGIKTPSGAEIGAVEEGLLPWGSEYRDVRVFLNEAYIQVKAFGNVEVGSYFFRIDWKPITFRLVDEGGSPIMGATVTISGPVNASALSDEKGFASFRLYKPGPYSVNVSFKGVSVAELRLGSIVSELIDVKCSVYRVSWVITDFWDKSLEGAEIVVKNGETLIARAFSNSGGTTEVLQIPGGEFSVQVSYKRVSKTSVEQINSNGVRRYKMDILFEIPLFGGIPLTTLETAAIGTAIGGGTAGLAFSKRKRMSTIEEVALEE
ncbi:MAG: carboxypeptidase-like regulatory domain-containing protein [Thermofilaceae archaeon]|nr:carboxypeptidase-like regulatory domain-containing protein [Thermofilaceae archaeon]